MSSTTACAFCGRDNDAGSRFCMDCGKPVTPGAPATAPPPPPSARREPSRTAAGGAGSGAPRPPEPPGRSAPAAPAAPSAGVAPPMRVGPASARCPKCARVVDPRLPFCAHCGARVAPTSREADCAACGAQYEIGVDHFCARCGAPVGAPGSAPPAAEPAKGTMVLGARNRETGPKLALLDEAGAVKATYILDRHEAVIGRGEADIRLDDPYLSPVHARFELREGELWVRDLGSLNGTWTFIDRPARLADGDVLLVGSQLLRFRRLGYPGPSPAEADGTRRLGSLTPTADVAVLEQLRGDGSVRDCLHLSPTRTVQLGRESGDWVFPYDQTMSGRHAELRTQDADFFVHDAGSRNGVALAVRGERIVREGQRVLVGDQVLRVESIGP